MLSLPTRHNSASSAKALTPRGPAAATPKKKPAKPSAASKRHASKATAGSSTNVPSSTTEPSGDVVTHL
ncbi:hypothetical protein BOTBODRAFT_175624 [Botryobasidium botryosum FD-172 SS1]|uniref:Uncharacterized protein n=1 Tax=Botryobasidium botryosum (strain FD-172 SS1) TaxID=930990 RepID=A0A067MNA1_BOTB1|nr:hypothetical protein BOTBODRAFT_175624 [Botryobasidium botryosum FD-172 SS1]